MKIAWISVNYKQERFLKGWRESIAGQSVPANHDVFVVDNSDSLASNEIDAEILNPKDNLGYFGGFNYCLDRIEPSAYDAVVLSNPDVTYDPDFVRALQQALEDHSGRSAMVLAPRITLDSGIEQNPNVANPIGRARKAYYELLFSSYVCFAVLGTLSEFFKRRRSPDTLHMTSRRIFMPHGACFIATPAFFSKCRRLDQRVFLWGEEAFLMHQVAQHEGEIWFVPSLRVFHHEHSSTAQIAARRRFELMRKAYLIYRDYL